MDEKQPTKTIWRNTGIGLILLSGVFFFTMLSVPWFPLTNGQKAMVAGGLFVGVQVSWWVGAALAGPAVVKVVRSLFRRDKSTPPVGNQNEENVDSD